MLIDLEPVCLGVLRDKNERLANRNIWMEIFKVSYLPSFDFLFRYFFHCIFLPLPLLLQRFRSLIDALWHISFLLCFLTNIIWTRQVRPHVSAPLLFNSNSLKLLLYVILLFNCLNFYQMNFVLLPLDVLEVF